MIPRAALFSFLFAASFVLRSSWAVADPPFSSDDLLGKVRPSIVQIKVIGDKNGSQFIENGTGFVVDTAQGIRVMTAGHVIHPDNFWDDPKNRLIYISWSNFGSTIHPDPVTEAKVENERDIAQVYVDPFAINTLKIVNFDYDPSEKLYVPTWPKGKTKAIIKEAGATHSDGFHFSLSGTYDYSESGSPVIDQSGQIVGILTDRTGDQGGLALVLNSPSAVGDVLATFRAQPVTKLVLPTRIQLNFDELAGNCAFLGKRSALVTHKPEDMPFGDDVLRAANKPETRESLIGKELAVVTPVNIRSRCPTVIDGSAYYGKVITRMEKNDKIRPQEIFALNYLDDIFYWTTVASAQKPQ